MVHIAYLVTPSSNLPEVEVSLRSVAAVFLTATLRRNGTIQLDTPNDQWMCPLVAKPPHYHMDTIDSYRCVFKHRCDGGGCLSRAIANPPVEGLYREPVAKTAPSKKA